MQITRLYSIIFIVLFLFIDRVMNHHVHSLNTSPAKQKYSFGKATRFNPYKPNTDLAYLPKVDRDRRSAIIGYGERSLVSDNFKKIYPHAYNVPSTIEANHGNSFKAGRHQLGGPMEVVKYSKSIPAPGDYIVPSTLDNKGVSLRPRLVDTSLKHLKDIPGPGAYSLPSSISNGQKNPFESKFSVEGGPRIPAKGFHSVQIRTPVNPKKQVPGPGQYNLQKYTVSNPEAVSYRKEGLVKFGKEVRHSIQNKNARYIPGPGQYKMYSEFDN